MEEKNDIKKILVMGLDNSGKTSIILVRFKKDVNLLNYLSLKPTKGIKISEIEQDGKKISLWDFGGQRQYRERYMKDMLDYLEATDEIIYVIDIQDKKRYEHALGYFDDIIKTAKLIDASLNITLYLHKYDPNIQEKDPSITDEFAAILTKKFLNLAPRDANFRVFKTTIFTHFNMDAFDFRKY